MVNIDDFIKRLEIILDYYSLNASSFADKIGVQRSSMSHLLSGRNKPSLDFILKIIDFFPEIDLYWIINGKGVFPKTTEDDLSKNKINSEFKNNTPTLSDDGNLTIDLFSEVENPIEEKKPESKIIQNTNLKNVAFSDDVEKIVFFYKNGTFKIYTGN